MSQGIFINHTNHPSDGWEEAQVQAAEDYGEIVDLPFPSVDPELDREDVHALAEKFLAKILDRNPAAVLCQGEFSYTYAMVNLLKMHHITALAASSERIVEKVKGMDGVEKKVSVFRFVRFREY